MRFEVGSLSIDADTQTVWSDGQSIAATPKVVDLLTALCEGRGNAVSKEALVARIWKDGYADDATVWQTVYLARKLLAKTGQAKIETIPRRGYRLVVQAPSTTVGPTPTVAEGTTTVAPRRWPNVVAVIMTLALILWSAFYIGARPQDYASLPSPSLRAYNLGEYYLRRRTQASAKLAQDEFSIVVRENPESALGYAGLSQTYVFEALETRRDRRMLLARASSAATEALRINPELSAAQTAVAAVMYLRSDQSWDHPDEPRVRAIDYAFRRALALNDEDAIAQMYYGEFLLERGEVDASLRHLLRAIDLDPSLSYANVLVAEASYVRRDPRTAIRYAIEGLGFGTADKVDALLTLGFAYEDVGKPQLALQAFRELRRYSASMGLAGSAYVAARLGQSDNARRSLQRALVAGGCGCGDFWLTVALTDAQLGNERAAEASILKIQSVPHSNAELALDPRIDALRRFTWLRYAINRTLGTDVWRIRAESD